MSKLIIGINQQGGEKSTETKTKEISISELPRNLRSGYFTLETLIRITFRNFLLSSVVRTIGTTEIMCRKWILRKVKRLLCVCGGGGITTAALLR
jgi:hypothetical protein